MKTDTKRKPTDKALRRGWTTGACATAATAAAYRLILTGTAPDPVQITLPKGQTPAFALARERCGPDWAEIGIIKDAGDDPDVTHGAMVLAKVRIRPPGSGICFKAGEGVGTVTRPGLPIGVGEPAINPVPRSMMMEVVSSVATECGGLGDVEIEVSIPGGESLAEKTMNARLGIRGGLSILGTTGIVRPFSCASWIASIHRGIDVARAAGLGHVAGSTGSTSEAAVQVFYDLPETALLDMGDFAGGLLKYLRRHPIAQLTIAGGPGKMTKLAQGNLDLHSARGSVDFDVLAQFMEEAGADKKSVKQTRSANTAKQVFDTAARNNIPLADVIAQAACRTVCDVLRDAPISANVLVIDRSGKVVGQSER
ncbi:MAG: cobalt-precorrin-5B (C(1))-methyltransferase [Stappiaceae bacterium]